MDHISSMLRKANSTSQCRKKGDPIFNLFILSAGRVLPFLCVLPRVNSCSKALEIQRSLELKSGQKIVIPRQLRSWYSLFYSEFYLLLLEKGKGVAAYLGLSMDSGPAFIFIQPFYLFFYSLFEGLATL